MPISPLPAEEGSMTSEEMKQDLQNKFNNVDNKAKQLNSNRIASKNKLENTKATFIKSLMSFLIQMGVDPSNPESINKFLQKLEAQNPDIAEIFSFAFDRLTQDIGSPQEGQELPQVGAPAKGGLPNLPQAGPQPMSSPPPSPEGLPNLPL